MMTSVPGVNSNVALNDLSHQLVRVQISKFPAIKITSNFRQKLHEPRKLNATFNNLARLIGQTINPSRPPLVAAQLETTISTCATLTKIKSTFLLLLLFPLFLLSPELQPLAFAHGAALDWGDLKGYGPKKSRKPPLRLRVRPYSLFQ
ncbi:hypothetical protein HanRHA438_Chr06g0263141 [Helianthus annuus]|nr:hypothetical protein HanRHA438_Chr06g0263141 [Helianthus annuus]